MTENDRVLSALADEVRTYRVRWEIDVRAASRTAAARKAQRVQLLPDSDALEFEVVEHDGAYPPACEVADTINLAEIEEEGSVPTHATGSSDRPASARRRWLTTYPFCLRHEPEEVWAELRLP
jgi:hypothetical protein